MTNRKKSAVSAALSVKDDGIYRRNVTLPLVSEGALPEGISDKTYGNGSYLLDDEFFERPLEESKELFRDESKRKELRGLLLKGVDDDPHIRAIATIAAEMKRTIKDKAWEQLQSEGAEALEERIQGKLDAGLLKNKLVWKANKNIDTGKMEKTQGYLRDWIERADEEQLKNFVRAVTSNNTLGPNDLKIELFNRGKDFIPMAHTCSFSLDLSVDYPDQKSFDEKLMRLLTEGLADGGFQIA